MLHGYCRCPTQSRYQSIYTNRVDSVIMDTTQYRYNSTTFNQTLFVRDRSATSWFLCIWRVSLLTAMPMNDEAIYVTFQFQCITCFVVRFSQGWRDMWSTWVGGLEQRQNLTANHFILTLRPSNQTFGNFLPVKVTLDSSGSTIESQWGSWKYPG